MATNSARHLAMEPKSRVIASASPPDGSPPPLRRDCRNRPHADHRVGGDQLLALQPVEAKAGNGRGIMGSKVAAYRIQPADSAAVIVLVVAGDQLGGKSVQPRRLEGNRTGKKRHETVSPRERG
jgi:hypothetical protein